MDYRYPIGEYVPKPFSEVLRRERLIDIAQLPNLAEASILNLDEVQLNTPYREGGWTVAQVIHHLVDSHLNCYTRVKLALTEENPTIRAYEENDWILLPDARLPVNNATTLLHALHVRLTSILSSVSEKDFNRTYVHPVSGQHSLWFLLGLYAWHGKHHVAQINALRERMGWF